MKRTLATLGLLFAGFLAGALYFGIPVGAGGQAGEPGRGSTGDTNGDGVLDVSDAVYLLRFLFQGGPPPAACAESPELVERVAALEEGLGAVVEVVGGVGQGLARLADAIESLEQPCKERDDRFIDHGDGTVTDTCTGLMWSRTTIDLTGDGRIRADPDRGLADLDTVTWDEAVAACEALTLAGRDGWRLPEISDFAKLFEGVTWYTHVRPPIEPAVGAVEGERSDRFSYWSATESSRSAERAWGWSPTETTPALARFKSERRLVMAIRDAE